MPPQFIFLKIQKCHYSIIFYKKMDPNEKQARTPLEPSIESLSEPVQENENSFIKVTTSQEESRGITHQEEILKMFQEMNKKNEMGEASHSKSKKNKDQFLNQKKEIDYRQRKKKDQIMRKIEPSIKKYKTLNMPNMHDSQLNKFRYQGKEKIFQYLLYGIQEMRQVHQKNQSQEQKSLTVMNTIDAYNYVKSITSEIDTSYLSIFNKNNKLTVNKQFRAKWKNLLINIQEESNLQLRVKILTKKWTGKELAALDDLDLYPEEKREKIIKKNKRLLNESTVIEHEQSMLKSFQENQNPTNLEAFPQTIQAPPQAPEQTFTDKNCVSMISKFMSKKYIDQLKEDIDETLKDGKVKQKIIRSIDQVLK